MTELDKEELMKLSPRERLSKLREIEKEQEEEKKLAEDLLQDTLRQLQHQEVIDSIETPEPQVVDISRLFGSEEGLEASIGGHITEDDSPAARYSANMYQGGNLGHHVIESSSDAKVDETLYTRSDAVESKKVVDSTDASRNIVESMRKYQRG